MPADNQPRPLSDLSLLEPSPPVLGIYDEHPAVTALLNGVPEFGPAYLALVETFDDDPGGPVVFTELADFVSERLVAIEAERPVLERTLAAVESVAEAGGEAGELVGYAFLDSLSPEDRRLITPWLGRATRSLMDELDAGLP
jgi:hypothetical protein